MYLRLSRVLILLFLLVSITAKSQGVWTWVKGDTTGFGPINIGQKGIPSPYNEPQPFLSGANWTDTSGRFWTYTGSDLDYMFMFDPATSMWTWVFGTTYPYEPKINAPKGVFSPDNSPGELTRVFSWLTPDNHMWLYGGYTYYYTFNAVPLWQYDPAINQWAWMGNFAPQHFGTKGVSDTLNAPGRRTESSCNWTDDDGNLWFFGGMGISAYNDMWKYNVSTGIWTWMSGSSDTADAGIYGTLGVPSVNIYPSARASKLSWKDNEGNFWLSGGADGPKVYQDVWKFNPHTLEWTWVKGKMGVDTSSATGNQCESTVQNNIGPRYRNASTWQICDDLILNYGGFKDEGVDLAINDMWVYSQRQNEWKLLGRWPVGTAYNTMGVPNVANHPCGRGGSVAFKGKDNSIWLFGGYGLHNFRNDLWKYAIDSTCLGAESCYNNYCKNISSVTISVADSVICSTSKTQICAPTGYSSYEWNQGGKDRCIEVNTVGRYYLSLRDTLGCVVTSNRASVDVYPTPSVSVTVKGDTLSSFGAVNYQWYKDGIDITGATDSTYIAISPGTYYVSIADENGCSAQSSPIILDKINGIQEGEYALGIKIFPNPVIDYLNISYSYAESSKVDMVIEIVNGLGQVVYSQPVPQYSGYQKIDVSRFSSGLYTTYIKRNSSIVATSRFAKE